MEANLDLSQLESFITSARPKDKLAKRACQIVESHLPSLVAEGPLLHTLVTVIPDPTTTIIDAWRALPAVQARVRAILEALPGMLFSIMATEVHPGPRPKRKRDQPQPAAGSAMNPSAQRESAAEEEDLLEAEAEEEAAPQAPTTETTAGPKGQQGKPHLHLLVYYPRNTSPPLDISHIKRLLQSEFPNADVNQVTLRATAKDLRKKTTGAMTYVLKGHNCSVRTRILNSIPYPGDRPSNDAMLVLGTQFAPGSPLGTRLKAMLRALSPIVSHDLLDVDEAEAPAHHEGPVGLSNETQCLLLLAVKLDQRGLRWRSGAWYKLQEGTQFTWQRAFDNDGLKASLSEDPQLLDILVRYATKVDGWFKLAPFKKLPDDHLRYIELSDCVYDIQTASYIHDDFSGACFRYYDISSLDSQLAEPITWLALVDNQYRAPQDQAEREEFLQAMAGLLRPRRPKDPEHKIPFIVGCSNSGKSTAIRWIIELYGQENIATINDSIAPLSGVIGKSVLVCDEFTTAKISRSNLLLLTDGTTGLVVRKMGQDAQFYANFLIPQVYTCNTGFEPKYKNDTTSALDNRFRFFRWDYTLSNPNAEDAAAVIAETPVIMFYLNRAYNK